MRVPGSEGGGAVGGNGGGGGAAASGALPTARGSEPMTLNPLTNWVSISLGREAISQKDESLPGG